MPTTCRCPNLGNCDKADKKELITIQDGADLVCPECEKELVALPAKPGGRGGLVKIVGAAIAVLAVLVVIWQAWLKPAGPNLTSVSAPIEKATAQPAAPPSAVPARSPVPSRNTILRLHGSNTIGAKLAPELAKAFLQQAGATNVHQVVGADKEESYVEGQLGGDPVPQAVEIHAHGSATAFKDLKAGTCDIGMASRKIKPEEVAELGSLGDLSSNASEHVIALDGIAIIVNPANPVRALSIDLVAQVFSGGIVNWSQVGGSASPITVYARDEKSGTWDTFNELVLKARGKTLASSARRFEDSERLCESVAQDAGGVGFVSVAYVKTRTDINAVALSDKGTQPLRPTERTVKTEDYPLSRRLYLYTPPASSNASVRKFVDFVLGGPGQQLVKSNDFIDLVLDRPEPVGQGDPRAAFKEWQQLTAGASEIPTRFRFRSGSSDLDSRAFRDIGRIAGVLSQPGYENGRLVLIGFADRTGSAEVNKRLSEDRCQIVQRELAQEGLKIEKCAGLGAEAPVASNDTVEGREKNRRVEIWVKK